MYAKVSQTIQRYDLITPEAPVVLGVSGGADSLCLLDCLTELGYNIIVAHLDHQLRPESGAEAAFVRHLCTQYSVPFKTEAINVGERVSARGSLEEAARLARYQFLARIAQEHNAPSVAVGHTADDQVETVVMHLLRGSGPTGLRGMLPKTRFTTWVGIGADSTIDLIRPLLELSRMDTVEHCRAKGLQPLEDPSNVELNFYRNRIRHELLPLLETYNPGIRQVILRLSDVMREQVEFNLAELDRVGPEVISQAGSNASLFDLEAFKKLHPTLQRELFRRAISALAPTLRDVGFDATVGAVEWLQNLAQGQALALPGGLMLERWEQNALLRKTGEPVGLTGYPQLMDSDELLLECPGEAYLAGDWRISARKEPNTPEARASWYAEGDQKIAILDTRVLSEGLRVRVRMSGDRIQLPHVGGRTKITDLMINKKIPRLMRARWPLVLVRDVIIWVPGIQRADLALLDDSQTHAVVLQLHPPTEVNHVKTAF